MRWSARTVVVISIGAVLAGCGGPGSSFKQPDITVSQVVVRGLGITGGTLDLLVRVDNPNNFNLRGTQLDAGFDVEQSHVGDIRYTSEFNVPSKGQTTLTLPIRFNWLGVGGAFRSLLGYGDLPYTIKGQATLDVSGTKMIVPFTREGRTPLTRSSTAPAVAPAPGGAPSR